MVKLPLMNALIDFKNTEKSGTDVFPVEFYRFFWHENSIKETDIFNFAFQSGMLSINQKSHSFTKKLKDKTILEI